VPLITFASVVLARAGISVSEQLLLFSLLVVFVVGHIVLSLFTRRIGGIDPKTGKPGGSTKKVFETVWFVAALVTGIYIASSYGGEAVGLILTPTT
jgi:hypothetical protein